MRPLLRRTTLVLWLMLALLPLRGWAYATMAAAGLHDGAAITAVTAEADDAMPCHAASEPQAEDDNAPAVCHLCDLCHAPMVTSALVPLTAFALPATAPDAAGDTRVPRPAPDRLERPPRST